MGYYTHQSRIFFRGSCNNTTNTVLFLLYYSSIHNLPKGASTNHIDKAGGRGGGYRMSNLLNKPRYVINLSTKGEEGSLQTLSAYSI